MLHPFLNYCPRRNLSFSYTGDDGDEESQCLKDINLYIPAGSVVVLVGHNGSGKSTLIQLLSQALQPSTGTILIDGCPSSEYSAASLRQSSAILAQDHQLLPFTLGENIGLGWASRYNDADLIREAAEKGGAKAFIEMYPAGYDTALNPYTLLETNQLIDADHPLNAEVAKVSRKLRLSGGEKQRVLA